MMQGEDLELVTEVEGITGMITEVTVKTRKAEEDIPLVASFLSFKQLLRALYDINQSSLPLWHIGFSNSAFTTRQEEAELAASKVKPHWGEEEIEQDNVIPEGKCCRALFVYPASRQKDIEPALKKS